MKETEREKAKTYRVAVEYVRQEVLEGRLHPGDRLPAERDLAASLDISRNSVREGLRVLENLGVVTSAQGSGNYIAINFDDTISESLSFLYFLKGMKETDVIEFRWMIEREAIRLAVKRISDDQKKRLQEEMKRLETAVTEDSQILSDRELHTIIVEASQNDFLIASYQALTGFMDRYIATMRRRIIRGMKSTNKLEESHRLLTEGLIEGDLDKVSRGLENHIGYLEQYR